MYMYMYMYMCEAQLKALFVFEGNPFTLYPFL